MSTAIEHVVMLVNPTSGRGRGGRNAPAAVERLLARGIQVTEVVGSSAAQATEAVTKAMAGKPDALIACGGDGTVNMALQLVAGTDIPLGVIPVGTGDDNARSLGLPLGDAGAAADVIADGHTKEVDCGHVTTADGTERWFLGVMSSGFDSLVNERANKLAWPKGQARYFVAVVAELSVFKPLPYHIQVDDLILDTTAMLVAVGNGKSYGGGMQVCPSAEMDDGTFAVTVLGKVSKPTFLRVFPQVFKGTHVKHPSVSVHNGASVSLEAPGQVAYADGERVGPLPLQARCHRSALRVIVPADS